MSATTALLFAGDCVQFQTPTGDVVEVGMFDNGTLRAYAHKSVFVVVPNSRNSITLRLESPQHAPTKHCVATEVTS